MIGQNAKGILALKFIKGVGDKSIRNYLVEHNNKVNLMYYDVIDTQKVKNIKKLTKEAWERYLDKADKEITKAQELDMSIISILDDEYPDNLKCLPNAPVVLYIKGDYHLLKSERSIAIIGTRKPTDYGKRIGTSFAKELAKDNFLIVSGLAIGCDTVAHQGALDGNGKTLAILAHGLDQPVYPRKNAKLAQEIINHGGALMSTYPIGTKLRPQFLAARDEWQSGLSDGVLVIETGIKGGTRIAMGHAGNQNRPLAVIDYRERGSKFINIDQFQGNLDAINHENAIPLFYKPSLEKFEQIMIARHRDRTNKIRQEDEYHQTELF